LRKGLLARSGNRASGANLSAGDFQFPMGKINPPPGGAKMPRHAFRDKD
jgi:hypothetical protein